jgi:hypothetical protein
MNPPPVSPLGSPAIESELYDLVSSRTTPLTINLRLLRCLQTPATMPGTPAMLSNIKILLNHC